MMMVITFLVIVMMLVAVSMPVRVSLVAMFMAVLVRVSVAMMLFRAMVVLVFQIHVELCTGDLAALLARDMKMIAVEAELLQFPPELVKIDAKVEQSADEHVAADAAENIQINRFHFPLVAASAASVLIWLAA